MKKKLFKKKNFFIIFCAIIIIICSGFFLLSIRIKATNLEKEIELTSINIINAEKERIKELDNLFSLLKNNVKITKEMTTAYNNLTINLKLGNLGGIQKEIEFINANLLISIARKYPSITSSQAYMSYMHACTMSESVIANECEGYNLAVNYYHDYIDTHKFLLNITKYKIKTYYLLNYKKKYKDTNYN